MKSCCEGKSDEIAQLRASQGHVLKIVLAINLLMFFVELAFGIRARSTSLLADSLDMFGDSAVYAFSLFVLTKSDYWRASAAFLKGLIMTAFGIAVFFEAWNKIFASIIPHSETISIVGIIALIANSICLILLLKHRRDDINMRSTWLCSRNDIVANIGVIGAGVAVSLMNSKWPDIAIGMIIAGIFLTTSFAVLRDSAKELKLNARIP